MIRGIRITLRSYQRISPALVGGGNRIYTNGSGIGSDPSMICANHRCASNASTSAAFHTSTITRILKSTGSASASVAVSESGSVSPTKLAPTSTSTSTVDLNTKHFSTGTGGMDDEYGEMTADGHTYVFPGSFLLENGEELPNAQLRYMTYGKLNKKRDNVLVVCHALTGNASLHSWWGDLLGPGLAFDTDKYFVVCSNILGSCYGSSGPATPLNGDNTRDGNGDRPIYGMAFPDISVKDTVKLQLHMLRDDLKLNSIKCVIGGSFGGMQAVEFAAQAGKIESDFAVDDAMGNAAPFVRSVMPIACGAAHTAWQIAMSEVQRQAIYMDPKWNGGDPSPDDPPLKGLSVARQIGMISYRTPKGYENKFGRKTSEEKPAYGSGAKWQVKSYLEYQGYKFLSRFDPITYLKLTEQMNTHDVGRGRGGKVKALRSVHIPAKILGIDSDILYPL